MNTTDKQLFIFVVNEEKKEFSRYKLSKLTKFEDNFKYLQEEKYTAVIIKNDDIKKEVERLLNQCKAHFTGGPNDIVDNVLDGVLSNNDIDDLLSRFQTLIQTVPDKEIDFRDFVSVTFFIHWGGGDVNSIKLNETLLNNFLKSAHYNNFLAYSLSSLRKQVFDVTAREIVVPDFDGLIELKNRLSILSQLDDCLVKFQLISDIISSKEMNLDSVLTENKLKVFKERINAILTTCHFDWLKELEKADFIKELNAFPFSDDSDKEKRKRRLENFALILSRIDKEFI